MPFFEYPQNNSGGRFNADHERGISAIVIIEAYDAREANDKARRLGLYFNGVSSYRDCSCCGDRWYAIVGSDGDFVPSHYGKPIQDEVWDYKWIKDGPEAYVHFANGTFQGYGLEVNQIG